MVDSLPWPAILLAMAGVSSQARIAPTLVGFAFALVAIGSVSAKPRCLSPALTDYTFGFCYLAEHLHGEKIEDHRDLIVLERKGKPLIESMTQMSITVGRIADLVLEREKKRFIAVS